MCAFALICRFSYVSQCFFQHLVFSRANSLQRWLHFQVGNEPDALKLPSIRMANSLPREVNPYSTRNAKIRHIAICACRRTANKFRAVGRLKEKPCVLRLADCPLIDEANEDQPKGLTRSYPGSSNQSLLTRAKWKPGHESPKTTS